MPETNIEKALPITSQSAKNIGQTGEVLTYEDLKHLEKENILATLHKTNWKISGVGGAAELLGTKPTTLASRIKALGIHR